MLIDIIAAALLVMALFKGLKNGLVMAVFSFLAFMIGLAAALKLSNVAAAYIGSQVSVSGRWLPFLAFLAVFIIVVILVRLGAKLIEGLMKVVMLGWLNRIGGFIFYALLYLFIYSILLFYGTRMHLIKPETAASSLTYSFLAPLAPSIIDGLGAIIPLFKNLFAGLESFFEKVPGAKS
jgi:membrane protein required for colicin V production